MDLFVPVLYDVPRHQRRRHPFRELFEPFERSMTPWFHTPHVFDPFDTVAVCTPWTRTFVGSHEEPAAGLKESKDEIKDTWETSLSLEGFDRDNVKVTALDDHSVLVEAKKVNVDQDGSQYEYQHLCRKLAVPENIDMKTLKVDLTEEGEMILKAGLPQLTEGQGAMDTSQGQGEGATPAPSGGGDSQTSLERQTSATEHPVSNVAERDQDFNVHFNLKGYPRDSIKVKVAGNRLSVHAKQEVKSDRGTVYRQFHQAMTIPPHINIDDIQSNLSDDGKLCITAKKHEEREIEVKME